ncbi:Helitron helicase [Phytophthora megakarya]|uniref:ATP-dependent DNA helicase n=1 Tax=Phytophthora megakarya TaxID=4795 RepID=A0A225V4E7_9STRA|nr:Helitron helicase [Phytophthora megakarya]
MSSISMFRHKILIASFFGSTLPLSVGDIVYPTFRDAAFAIEYLEDNQEWLHGLTEAAYEKMPYQLRQLIAIVLVYSHLPGVVENIHREDEVLVRMAEYKTLKYVANYLASSGKTLEGYGFPELNTYSDVSAEVDDPATESIALQELNAYSPTDLEHVTELVGQLNRNQRDVFDQVVRAVEHPVGGEKLFFLDGTGGTGKSFLLEQIFAHVRCQRTSAIAAASSDTAATLLTGGIPQIRRFVSLSN